MYLRLSYYSCVLIKFPLGSLQWLRLLPIPGDVRQWHANRGWAVPRATACTEGRGESKQGGGLRELVGAAVRGGDALVEVEKVF